MIEKIKNYIESSLKEDDEFVSNEEVVNMFTKAIRNMLSVLLICIVIFLLTGCGQVRYVKEIQTQEIYVPVAVDVAKVDCRYQDAKDIDELVNYLIECVINYEAYIRTIKTESCKLEKKQ